MEDLRSTRLEQGLRLGRVTSFDSARGRGEVRDEQGQVFGFHCVAIADRSRHIDVDTAVAFQVGPGPCGRFEATTLRKTG